MIALALKPENCSTLLSHSFWGDLSLFARLKTSLSHDWRGKPRQAPPTQSIFSQTHSSRARPKCTTKAGFANFKSRRAHTNGTST